MLVEMGGSSEPPPPPPPPPPTAKDVATATTNLQAKLGNANSANEAAYEAQLQAAIKAIEDANAQANRQALAEAAILMQQRRDAQAKQANAAGVDSLTEATSEVGLTHQFDPSTLAAASKALGGSSLKVDPSTKGSPVSLASAVAEISNDQKSGMTLQEAVNAARVAFGGSAQNEVVLNEAAIVTTATPLANDPSGKGGATALATSAQTVAGQHLFSNDVAQSALKALTVNVTATPALKTDAHNAQSAYAALQKDKANHASATQLAQDEATYHQALSNEYNDAAGETNDDWRSNVTQIDRGWQAQQTVLDLNTAAGLPSAPSRAELTASLSAAQILDAEQTARGSGGAAGNLKAAQTLTQQLQGVSSDNPIYAEVMGDARTQSLQSAALHDIVTAHGGNANDTLVAVSNTLAGYRNTVLYQGTNGTGLADSVLHDPGVAKTIASIQVPNDLPGMTKLLQQVSSGSPQLAQALYTQRLAQPMKALITQGGNEAPLTGDDTFLGYSAQAIQALDPNSAAGQDLMKTLNAELGQLAKSPSMTLSGQTTGLAGPNSPSLAPISLTPAGPAPTGVYQTLLNEDSHNAPLAHLLERDTGLTPTGAAPGSAPQDAAQLSTATTALSTAAANNTSPAAILAAAKKAQPLISDTTWAQAMILNQAVTDGQKWTSANAAAIKAGTAPTPPDMIKQASGEIGGQQLFDANTMANATSSLESGAVYAVPGAAEPKGSSQVDPLSELSQYQSMGIPLPAAVVMVRQEMGGSAANEQVIMQAVVTLSGEQFASDPTQTDPIAAGLQLLQQSAPNLFSANEQSTLASVAKSMEQNPTVDQKALNSAITKAQKDKQTLDAANQRAKQNPNDASAKQAAAAAQAAYQADLTAALNIAGGHNPNDSAWQAQSSNVDSLWKAQFTVAAQMLAPQIQAAQGTAQNSPENQALDTAFGDLQTSLQAEQIVQQTLYEQESKADGGAGGGNAAAAQLLTSEIGGLAPGDPLYDQVMNSAGVTALQTSIQQDVTGGLTLQCTTADGTNKELVALGNRLSVYQGTVFYPTLLNNTVHAAPTQALFDSVASEVDSKSKPLDRLNALASATQGMNPDLAAALNRAKFDGNDPKHPGGDVLQWLKQDGTTASLQPVALIYANLGASQNPDLTPVRQWLEQAMTKASGDGGIADLHTTYAGGKYGWETGKSNTTLVYGLDSLKSQTDKSQMQLFQDILDDHGVSSTVAQEISKETGYQANGGTPAALSADLDGNLDGLAGVDGMHGVTSFNKAVDAIGQMEGLTPTHAAQSLDDVRADELGTRSLYDPNTVVYSSGGKKTTIADMARQLMSGEGVSQISGIDPLMLTSLSLSFQGKDGSTWQGALLEGIGQDGNYVDVGPVDTQARHGLSDWYNHTGFGKGEVQVQPHWVLGGNGQQLLGDAYLDTHRTGVYHWYDWDNIQAGLMVVAAIVTIAAMPEAAPLWLEGLSLALDGYFAVSSAIQAQQAFAQHDDKQGWMDVAFAAAGIFGGVLSSAKMLGRLGVASSRFAEASGLAKLAEQGKGVQAYKNASLARWLDDSRLGQWAAPKLASGVRIANTIQGPLRLVDASGQRVFNTVGLAHRALSFTSMGIGIFQMGDQGITLIRDRNQATGEDWLQFFTGMTAMAVGAAGSRIHAARATGDTSDGAATQGETTEQQTESTQENEPIVLTAANVKAPPSNAAGEEASPDLTTQRKIALATFKLALAQKAAQAAAAMRAAATSAGTRVVNAVSQAGGTQAGTDNGGGGGNGGNGTTNYEGPIWIGPAQVDDALGIARVQSETMDAFDVQDPDSSDGSGYPQQWIDNRKRVLQSPSNAALKESRIAAAAGDPAQLHLVAKSADGQVIAYCSATAGSDATSIDALYVAPRYGRLGAGRGLVQSVIEWAGPDAPVESWITPTEGVTPFFQSQGFETVDDTEREFTVDGQPVKRVLMRRPASAPAAETENPPPQNVVSPPVTPVSTAPKGPVTKNVPIAPAASSAPSPQESLDALLDRVLYVTPSDEDEVYALYAKGDSPRPAQLTEDQRSGYLEKIKALLENRPADSDAKEQKTLGSLSDFLRLFREGGNTFYHFLPPNAIRPDYPYERIYINAMPEHAADVMTFLVRNVMDDHQAYPDVDSAKVSSPLVAHARVDNIVVYTKDSESAERVLNALSEYQQAHPDHFGIEVPAMTQGVLPGISVGAEPPPEKGNVSFGQLRSDAIWKAFKQTTTERINRTLLGESFDARAFLGERARAELAAAGVDPNDPSRNLPPDPSANRSAPPAPAPAPVNAPPIVQTLSEEEEEEKQPTVPPQQPPAQQAPQHPPAPQQQAPAQVQQAAPPQPPQQPPAPQQQAPAQVKVQQVAPVQPPQQPHAPPPGAATLPSRSDGVSITAAKDAKELDYQHAKPGGHWVGEIVRDPQGKFGAQGGLVLLKQLWGAGEGPELSEARARNAVTTSKLMRKIFGEGSAVPIHLVHWDIKGERYYGVAMPYLDIDVFDKGSYKTLTDPTQGDATGLHATAAGHIALNNTAVAGVTSTDKGPRLGNLGLGKGGKGKKSAVFLDLDTTMRIDSQGNARPFDPLAASDVPSALDTLRTADDSAPIYGSMTSQQYFSGVDRLYEHVTYHGLGDDIRAIVEEHGAGTADERTSDADTILANIQAQFDYRESMLGSYTGQGSRPLSAAELPEGFATAPKQETGKRLRNPLLHSSTMTGRRRLLHAPNTLELAVHRMRRSMRGETHVWPDTAPDLASLVPPPTPKLPGSGTVIKADENAEFSPSALSGKGLTFGVTNGTPRRGLGTYLDGTDPKTSTPLEPNEVAQWDPDPQSGQAASQPGTSNGLLGKVRGKLTGIKTGTMGAIKDESKDRLYLYAQDGAGLPLGYYERSDDGEALTWYGASHRTRAQKAYAAAIGGSTFLVSLGVGTAVRLAGVVSDIPLMSPVLSTIRSAINLGKVANESRQQVFNEIRDQRLEQATELINRRHSLAQRALKSLGVPPSVRTRVQAHTETLLGVLQQVQSEAWPDHKPEVTLSDALTNYNDMIKHETGYKFSQLEAMNTGRLRGKLFRGGTILTFSGSGAKYETKFDQLPHGSGLEAVGNLLGATASVADSSAALATSVTGSRPNAVSKFSGKASKFLAPISTYGFAAGYGIDAFAGAHNHFVLAADLAAALTGTVARRYTLFMQRVDDNILVYESGTQTPEKGDLIGYASYTGDGRLKWYKRNGTDGFHEVRNMSAIDLDNALLDHINQKGGDPSHLRFIVARKTPGEVDDDFLKTAKQTGERARVTKTKIKTTSSAKSKPVQLQSMAEVVNRTESHGNYQKAASFAFWAAGASLAATVLSTAASTFFNQAPTSSQSNLTPAGGDKKKKPAPPAGGTSSAPEGPPGGGRKPKPIVPTGEPWRVVIVKQGDTLWGIATDNGDTIEQIEPLNPEFDWALLDGNPFSVPPPGAGRNPNLIFPGDRVKVTQQA
ncbi:GNAT family N-acetyltransferase [Trinickia dinghuensis]|uniref:GNAT family N-acetyltransferase n=1 Tax=Trinickia dinghuensis TaxID=2291023 RepID=A0A3D8JW93_9BURK|nr:GNAT family N-acetyltransferase [Trinickia dinghuensis]RDU96874.1 GNAT family N-acetyltransferase [Trinickia dinghuensis]